MEIIITIVILLLSVIIHEVSHGYAALYFGDETAKHAGRLTLNPIKHLDPFGSIILPALLVLSGTGLVFGWAKPVPYNPNNLRDRKKGTILVASAGILANLLLAILFSIVIRIMFAMGLEGSSFIDIATLIVFINLLLAVFNLVPIPPLDGSKILFEFLPARSHHIAYNMERYGIFLLIFFIVFFWKFISPVILYLFQFMTGITLF